MLVILTLIGIMASGGAKAPDAPVSVCTIASDPERFAGKSISVRAAVLPTRHGIGLLDSDCPDVLVALGSSSSDAPGSPNARFYDA